LLFDHTILAGPATSATIGFHKKSRNGIFLFFLYIHFATRPAAFLAFLFQPDPTGLIQI